MTLAPIRGARPASPVNGFTPTTIGFFDGAIMGGAARKDQESGRQSAAHFAARAVTRLLAPRGDKPVVPDTPPVRRWLDAGYRAAYRMAFPLARRWRLRGHGGTAIIIWLDNRVLTVLHSYKPGLGLPGGSVKTGEDHSAAAVRELREETGVVIPQAHLRLLLAYRGRYGMRSIFEARLDHEPTLRADQREIVYGGFNAPKEVTEYNRTVKGYLLVRCDRPAAYRWHVRA
jgi:8-oxo-dGTP pyrophosphatase MutT (NUDIX family)